MPSHKSKEFLDLQTEWYQKLKDEGFRDIEDNERDLKFSATTVYAKKKYNEVKARAKEEYYRLAGQFLHDYKFESELDKIIWEMHSEGQGSRKIAAVLKTEGEKDKIIKVIKRLRSEMLIKCR